MEFITWVYFIFIMISMYLTMLFIIIYIQNYKHLFKDKIPNKLKTLSLIIPAWNEGKTIAKTIKTVQAMDYPKKLIEIILINDHSTDNTLKEMQKFSKFKNITIINHTKNMGKSHSLNQAIKIAKGELIVTIDADSFPTKDSLLKMVGYFDDPKTGAVTSSILCKKEKGILATMQTIEYRLVAFARKLFDFINSVHVNPGPLSMYRKSLVKQIGGFDPNNMTEDIDMGWRILNAGYRNRMCLSAKVYCTLPLKLKSWWKQRLRWNLGGMQTLFKHKHVLFNPKKSTLGLFVAPRLLLAYVLSITGLAIFGYLTLAKIKGELLATKLATETGVPQIALYDLHLTPTVFTFFILLFLVITIIYTVIGLKTLNHGKIGIKYSIPKLALYLLVYLIFFPFILINSIYLLIKKALIKKDIKWR